MKLFLIALLLLATPLQAQDTVRVKHSNYESVFSKSKKYPVLVEWWVTTAKIKCSNPAKRGDKFIPDPKLPVESNIAADYVGSGFDRGHLAPAADQQCLGATVMAESFYFTNMAPQHPGLNRGQWKSLEDYTRKLALEHDSVFVQTGCVGEASRIKRVAVPTHCWKVIRVKNQTEAYVFPNVPERSKSFEMHKVQMDSIKSLTKLPIQ
jgi:endonuclease G